MEAVFQLPSVWVGSWLEGADRLEAAGYVVAGIRPGEGSIKLDELVTENHQKLALTFGNKGRGLTAETGAMVNRCVSIPMMGGVDSLNETSSAAVALSVTR